MGKLWLGDSNGCWLQIWDSVHYGGNGTILHGPADFPFLRIATEQWHPQIMSAIVGPGAYVVCYEDLNFKESVFWLTPGQRIPDLTLISPNDEIDSLRIFDRPPFEGEPGYAAYRALIARFSNAGSKN